MELGGDCGSYPQFNALSNPYNSSQIICERNNIKPKGELQGIVQHIADTFEN